MKKFRYSVYIALALTIGASLALALGGPQAPAPMASINDPFEKVSYKDLPERLFTTARDGTRLAYRFYPPATASASGVVVMVHGSSGSSRSLHRMGRALASAGYGAYALDIRGHGASGVEGHIAYVGQLEDDLADFTKNVVPDCPRTLLGFSAGGGFALRVASSERGNLFDHYLLLSPFLHQDAPTYQPGSGGWVDVGIPRIAGLTLLNELGITSFNHLPVLAFALPADSPEHLTPRYSYNLAMNFRPPNNYAAAIADIHQPTQVLVGEEDEVFIADAFKTVFRQANPEIGVRVVPELNHVGLTLDEQGISAVLSEIKRLPDDPAVDNAPCEFNY